MWKICGELRLNFFTMQKNAEIINLNKFCNGKYLRKISSAEILDLDNFKSGKYLRKLISPDHKLFFFLSFSDLTHSHTMTPFDAPGKQAF